MGHVEVTKMLYITYLLLHSTNMILATFKNSNMIPQFSLKILTMS